MNDFYSVAAQIIPVLLLTLVLESPRRLRDLFPGTPARVRRGLALFSALLWLSVLAEVLALGGLSFDEERFPELNTAVGIFVWSDVLVLTGAIAWVAVRTLQRTFRDGGDSGT
ncbi:hypothetical protein [Streptomyces atriruber]|uniref:hypothetical protein n=1 Tax=Streptomyces atriruber TaxID=545121 RepID=UPI0006E29E62|nr:hypothetical protein [Streptomyces atriruber]